MKKVLLNILAATLFLGACTDLTEEVYDKIPGDQYPENDAQVATLTVPAYKTLYNLADDWGWWYLSQIITSDEVCFPTRGTDWDDGGKWRVLHQHQWTDDVDAVNSMWDHFWQGITLCNQIHDQLSLYDQNELILAKKAEVRTMRSYYYYLLMDNYGDAPYLESAIDAPELPEKVTRAEIFNNITAQLEGDINLLKPDNNKYLATQNFANAILAKLYMNAQVYTGTAMWTKADEFVTKVIDGPYNLDANASDPFVTNNESSKENIFTINFDENNAPGFRIHMRTLHYSSNQTFDMNVGPWNGGACQPDFFDKFDAADRRKDAYLLYGPQFKSDGSEIIYDGTPLVLTPEIPSLEIPASASTAEVKNSGARMQKYEIAKGAMENLSNDFVVFRLTDFMLMKTELILMHGVTGDALMYINPIRTRAGLDTYTTATLTVDEFKNERGRELFAEGHRRQDLIRWNDFTKSWWEKAISSSERTIFPIPKWAKDANPNL
ncbi:RagB/SusD family nutrient uptake outer membrane protein [Carboxylicivirga sp. M1479]|uniref:RagB/SusD family nutrient uptake outer membrane protein n=1 Tax=Carboxylicivirga sp. M1479 TaxID=2594476 RepID=UPI0011773973|nr:RagB/SusD family nutrient uptake outer membrane protein [Carboxylicivirga sp. M1479]TRX71582.1 RagB/SusD family nutrient uptake outer membrane protein [Carboxylicivirga sp. M1479]